MEKYFDQAVASIAESIRFDSSLSESAPDMPFGKGAYECLHHFLSLAEKLGFETNNYDNYIGEVLFGEGEEEFAVLAHLDVVPAGSGWEKDPFGGEISDGKIWGRGAVDDKGPAICCLYALKALKDEGFVPHKKIKLIVGCNEEAGWGCIEHYKKCARLPEIGFSPDADFPVIYAEKGILHLRFHFPVTRPPFHSLEGGSTANMVCDYCTVTPRSTARLHTEHLTQDGKRFYFQGKSAHGSTPALGVNAIQPVLELFRNTNASVKRVLECLFDDVYELRKLRDQTGSLTLSPNIIKFRRGNLDVICDIRYPATMSLSEVLAAVNRFGVKYETLHHQEPLFHAKSDLLIATLLSVYRECTGLPELPCVPAEKQAPEEESEITESEIVENAETESGQETIAETETESETEDEAETETEEAAEREEGETEETTEEEPNEEEEEPYDPVQPIAIGGGTYARALKHGAAFGPEMEGDEAVVHRPNEYITLDRVKLLLKIYKTAIERLTVMPR